MKLTSFQSPIKNILYSLVFISLVAGCGGDETPSSTATVTGTYQFSSATFVNSASFTNNQVAFTANAGDDGSSYVSEPLLAEAPCEGPENARIEFRDDGKTYLICLNETTPAEEQGTWVINSNQTALTLNIPNSASPSGTASIQISNLNITDTGITGRISTLPTPIEITEPISYPSNVQFIAVDVVFIRVP